WYLVVINGTIDGIRTDAIKRAFNGDLAEISVIWDNSLTAPFALFMSIWSVMFLQFWKRTNSSIQYDWGITEFAKEELPRPEFYGTTIRKSPITMKNEIHFPLRHRIQKLVISGMVVFISIYKNVAWWLTNFENHKTPTQFEDSLIIKSYLFDFFNFYSTLFYIMIFKEQYVGELIKQKNIGCEYKNCMIELTIQLPIILIGMQIIGQFSEILIPWALSKLEKRQIVREMKILKGKYRRSGKKNTEIPQWIYDDRLSPNTGTIVEYEEMVIQFGFIALFGSAFPLAPLFAWLNNIVEIRADAFKFIVELQRTFEEILNILAFMAVLTNTIIIAFHSTWMKQQLQQIITCIFADTTISCIYNIDVPSAVRLATEREKYLVKLTMGDIYPALDEFLSTNDSSLFDHNGELKLPKYETEKSITSVGVVNGIDAAVSSMVSKNGNAVKD
ncbi:13109_t:CDS:10, partial [Gigaspora rosea]